MPTSALRLFALRDLQTQSVRMSHPPEANIGYYSDNSRTFQ